MVGRLRQWKGEARDISGIRNSKRLRTSSLAVACGRIASIHGEFLIEWNRRGVLATTRAVRTRLDSGQWVEYDICKSGQARVNWQIYAQFMSCVFHELVNVFFDITTAV